MDRDQIGVAKAITPTPNPDAIDSVTGRGCFVITNHSRTVMAVKTRIIRIGNSQGVRIPRPLLEQSGISGDVELEVEDNKIIIHGVGASRRGWGAAFAAMAERGDDRLLDPEAVESEWDAEEWRWE